MVKKYTLTEKGTGKTLHTYDPYQAQEMVTANELAGAEVILTVTEEKEDSDGHHGE